DSADHGLTGSDGPKHGNARRSGTEQGLEASETILLGETLAYIGREVSWRRSRASPRPCTGRNHRSAISPAPGRTDADSIDYARPIVLGTRAAARLNGLFA